MLPGTQSLLIVVYILGLFTNKFISNYISKKAENLATKEDIEAITKKIESVRSIIEINTDAHKAYVNVRKEYLIKFYDEITVFHYELVAVNFGDFPIDAGESLFKYQQNFSKSVVNILKAYQRLVIYLPEESKLLKIANQITTNVIDSSKTLKSNFGSIKVTMAEEVDAYKSIINNDKSYYQAAVESANYANKNYWKLMTPLANSFRNNYQLYLTESNVYLRASEINT